jgi:hypothetical protein
MPDSHRGFWPGQGARRGDAVTECVHASVLWSSQIGSRVVTAACGRCYPDLDVTAGFVDYQSTPRKWRSILEDGSRCLPRPANPRSNDIPSEDTALGSFFGEQAPSRKHRSRAVARASAPLHRL